MSVTIDIAAALATAVTSAITADSGTNGLADATGTAYVRKVARLGDPAERNNQVWPRILIDTAPTPSQTFGTGDREEVILRLQVVTKRDVGFTGGGGNAGPDPIFVRLRALFNGANSLTITGGWALSMMTQVRSPAQLPGDANQMRWLVEYRVIAGA